MVSAWKTKYDAAGVNPVPFDIVGANIGKMWDADTHKFTMKAEQGVFYVAMDAGSLIQKRLNFVLQKAGKPFASCSTDYGTRFNPFSTGRDIILRVNKSETLHFTSSTGLFSNYGMYTNIAIFNIVELMSSDNGPVVFSVARNQFLRGPSIPVTFNHVLVINYSYYDVSRNVFTAPSPGIYFFSLSVGVVVRTPAELIIYVNDVPFTSIIRESTSHSGTDVIGRSIMMNLNTSDTVYVVNRKNKVVWSSQRLETSFAGFKYEPAHGHKVSKNSKPRSISGLLLVK